MMFLGLGCGSKVSGVYYRDFPGISEPARHEWKFLSDGTVLWKQRYGIVSRGTYQVMGNTVTATYHDIVEDTKTYSIEYSIEGTDLVETKSGNRLHRMK